jgi:glycosyltransferase involved in cell wall biosynthesis
MKILISAYACAPNRGSEHGVGWNWATEAHRLGHQVWVMVSPAHRDAIAGAVRTDASLEAIHWTFPELSYWPLQQGKEPKFERTYNLLWQRAALRMARALQCQVGFDVVHHLTWGGLRAPTFLGSLGMPLIVGPMGGGETSPKSLRDRLPLKGRILEKLRDISNATIEINPVVRRGLRDAAVIFAKTADTRNMLSPPLRAKTSVMMELVVSRQQIGSPRVSRQSPTKLLYAGRLLYWKGAHIAVEAMVTLVRRLPNAHLTIVGSGSEAGRLKNRVAEAGLSNYVEFIPWIAQKELFRLYDSHDLLVFPSLHDSTGGVVLEALCRGMPVACLDVGGPKEIVTPESGIIVRTTGLTTSQVAIQLANRLCDALSSPATMERMSAAAIDRAHTFLITPRVADLYEEAWGVIGNGNNAMTGHAMPLTHNPELPMAGGQKSPALSKRPTS